MTGKMSSNPRDLTKDWLVLMDAMEKEAGDYVPCMNYPDLFFQELKGSDAIHNQRLAKELCSGCPIIVQCLDYAMKQNEEYGIWGGLSPYERKQLRNKAKRKK